MQLQEWGWSAYFTQCFESLATPGVPARVVLAHRGVFSLISETGEAEAPLSGRFLYRAHDPADWPVTGDWVVLHPGGQRIEALLPRQTVIVRKQPGENATAQVLAANVDTLFIVCGLDGDFSPRRIERYLVLAAESGAAPVVVLNKRDLRRDWQECAEECSAAAPGVPVVALAAEAGDGLEQLAPWLQPARTAAFIGSSGAGKSTLINRLLGHAAQRVNAVREGDSRGRHTTTNRELFRAPEGWLLLDMPGLREIQLWAGSGGVERAFSDVSELASQCRYRDCRHSGEPGCAVRDAVDPDRLASYGKLQREIAHLERQTDRLAADRHKRGVKAIHRAQKALKRPPTRPPW